MADSQEIMDVTMPDGVVLKGVPAGTPKDQIMAKYKGQSGSQIQQNTASSAVNPLNSKPQHAPNMGENILQGAGNVANSINENVLQPIGKMVAGAVPESYRKATDAGAKAMAGGLEKATDATKNLPGLQSYKDAINTVREGMLNPEKTKDPEFSKDVKAAWDLIQTGGGIKGMIEGGLLAAKGGLASGGLAIKGAKTAATGAAETVAPKYMAKQAEISKTNALPIAEKLQAVRNKQYAVADSEKTKYDPSLNDNFIKKVESKLEQPRGENIPGLSDEEEAEMKALQNSKKLSPKGKEALEDLETRSKETGLSSAQEKKNKVYNEYIKLYKDNPITSFSGLRSLERELTDKISKEINPATHKVNETGQALLDVRQHLHDMYLSPKGEFINGSPKGVQAHLAANKAYSQEVKANQLEEAKMIGGGDAEAERNAYRTMYKRALKQRQFWSETELKELHALGKKPGVLGKMVKGAVAHKTLGLSKLLPESAVDTSKLENLLLKGQ